MLPFLSFSLSFDRHRSPLFSGSHFYLLELLLYCTCIKVKLKYASLTYNKTVTSTKTRKSLLHTKIRYKASLKKQITRLAHMILLQVIQSWNGNNSMIVLRAMMVTLEQQCKFKTCLSFTDQNFDPILDHWLRSRTLHHSLVFLKATKETHLSKKEREKKKWQLISQRKRGAAISFNFH